MIEHEAYQENQKVDEHSLELAGNLILGKNVPAQIVEDRSTYEHNQAVVLSRKRRVDSDHILFRIVRWRTIKILAHHGPTNTVS